MRAAPALHFVVPVWGESYVDVFLNYCLPAQLSPGNIQALGEGGHRYQIYTSHADHERLQASPAYQALQRAIPVSVEFIDARLSPASGRPEDKYSVKSDCYRDALVRAAAVRAAVVTLNADILLADGFVRSVLDLLSQGKRVIEVPGPRGLRDPIGKALLARFRSADGPAISIQPVELSALWLQHLHPQLAMHYVEGPEGGSFHPSHLYWLVGDEGVIIRGFHLYPIVTDPQDRAVRISTSIDDDLVANLRLSPDLVYLAQDSREMFCCELSPPEHYVGQMANRGDLHRYVEFYLSYGTANLRNLRKEIIITRSRKLGPQWAARRRQSALFTKRLIRACEAEHRRQLVHAWLARVGSAVTGAFRGR